MSKYNEFSKMLADIDEYRIKNDEKIRGIASKLHLEFFEIFRL